MDLIPLGDELIPAGFQSGYLVRSGSKLRARWKNDVISLGDDVNRFNLTPFLFFTLNLFRCPQGIGNGFRICFFLPFRTYETADLRAVRLHDAAI